MFSRILFPIVVAVIGLFLASCQTTPQTPQQVTQHFWQAVIEDRPEEIVKYSTLANASAYDSFARNWKGFALDLGKIVIENRRASVETSLSAPDGNEAETRKLTTYLLMHEDQWTVDYNKTSEGLQKDKTSSLLGKLNKLGKKLSEQLEESGTELNTEIELLGEKIQALSEEVGKEAAEGLEKFTDELEKGLEDLEDSIDRALKDRKQQEDDSKLQEI